MGSTLLTKWSPTCKVQSLIHQVTWSFSHNLRPMLPKSISSYAGTYWFTRNSKPSLITGTSAKRYQNGYDGYAWCTKPRSVNFVYQHYHLETARVLGILSAGGAAKACHDKLMMPVCDQDVDFITSKGKCIPFDHLGSFRFSNAADTNRRGLKSDNLLGVFIYRPDPNQPMGLNTGDPDAYSPKTAVAKKWYHDVYTLCARRQAKFIKTSAWSFKGGSTYDSKRVTRVTLPHARASKMDLLAACGKQDLMPVCFNLYMYDGMCIPLVTATSPVAKIIDFGTRNTDWLKGKGIDQAQNVAGASLYRGGPGTTTAHIGASAGNGSPHNHVMMTSHGFETLCTADFKFPEFMKLNTFQSSTQQEGFKNIQIFQSKVPGYMTNANALAVCKSRGLLPVCAHPAYQCKSNNYDRKKTNKYHLNDVQMGCTNNTDLIYRSRPNCFETRTESFECGTEQNQTTGVIKRKSCNPIRYNYGFNCVWNRTRAPQYCIPIAPTGAEQWIYEFPTLTFVQPKKAQISTLGMFFWAGTHTNKMVFSDGKSHVPTRAPTRAPTVSRRRGGRRLLAEEQDEETDNDDLEKPQEAEEHDLEKPNGAQLQEGDSTGGKTGYWWQHRRRTRRPTRFPTYYPTGYPTAYPTRNPTQRPRPSPPPQPPAPPPVIKQDQTVRTRDLLQKDRYTWCARYL